MRHRDSRPRRTASSTSSSRCHLWFVIGAAVTLCGTPLCTARRQDCDQEGRCHSPRVSRHPRHLVCQPSLPGNQVVLSCDYLPTSVATLPRICKLKSPVERALLASPSQVQHAGYHLNIAKVMELQALIAGPLDAIGSGDALDHRVAI